jgi:hypothetical protein
MPSRSEDERVDHEPVLVDQLVRHERVRYSIIRAEDRDEVLDFVRDPPFLAAGSGYTIEAFDVPRK